MMTKKVEKLFGTDGIRDVAYQGVLSPESLLRLGNVIGYFLNKKSSVKSKKEDLNVLFIQDTRVSCEMIKGCLSNGLRSYGVNVFDALISPTPSASVLMHNGNFKLAFVVSASHNPPEDNGIKILSANGLKLSDISESLIEKLFFSEKDFKGTNKTGKYNLVPQLIDEYITYLIKIVGRKLVLSNLKIAIDCSNGSTYSIAPFVFKSLGAKVFVTGSSPDGFNINKDCGCLNINNIKKIVLKNSADIGFSFDGDGDRVITFTKNKILDGDYEMFIIAKFLKKHKMLNKNTVVATVMSNLGFERALNNIGIKLVRTNVGDKYVSEKIIGNKYSLGGEQSGHIIIPQYSLTGDGLITALMLLRVMLSENKDLVELSRQFKKFPQILLNVPVKRKIPFEEITELLQEINLWKKKLEPYGRVLVRYSGTENLARVMVEGISKSLTRNAADNISEKIKMFCS